MKSGNKKILNEQYTYISNFFHGRPPNYPSQIQLLSEGRVAYADFYEKVEFDATKKSDNISSVKSLRLKQILTRDERRLFYSGVYIRSMDLENENKTGTVLIGGRNLLDLAQKGSRSYKKALAFDYHKWNSVLMEPKESGDTINDYIEYVRRQMYIDGMKSPEN